MKPGQALLVSLLVLGCGKDTLSHVRARLVPPVGPIDFGAVPLLNERQLDVPLQNLGRVALNVDSLSLMTGDGLFRLVSGPRQVAGGATESVALAFVPQREEASTDTLLLDTDDLDNPHLELALVGLGSTRATMEVHPAALTFTRVAECGAALAGLTIRSRGTADLVLQEIALSADSHPGFSLVGSTKTPAVVSPPGSTGLPGQIQLTVKFAPPPGASGAASGALRLRTTDPDRREVSIPLLATVNRAPVPIIAALGNAAPGQLVTLDASASGDPDGDLPLTSRWVLRSKPLSSSTVIAAPEMSQTTMRLDPLVPGLYEVQLDVTDAAQVRSCASATATVVAAPAQKLLVELYWDNAGTDLDLHVLRSNQAPLFRPPGDCFYQNRTPDWGAPGPDDDPELSRDALTGYGPELFGYVNPVDSAGPDGGSSGNGGPYRVVVHFANDLLSPAPASRATVRIYQYGILKAERSKVLLAENEVWEVADVTWPSGEIHPLP